MQTLKCKLIFILSVVVSCTTEEPTTRNYPRVDTKAVSNITETSATFTGEITFTPGAVIDHGFTWSNYANFDPGEGDEISIGPATGTGTFSAVCSYAMKKGEKYYVRAYAKSADYAVYGDVMTFISQGCESPVFTSFSPHEGTWDDLITLQGTNLTAIKSNLVVKFGSFDAFIVESGYDHVTVKVPYQMEQKESNISLTWNTISMTAPDKFNLKEPIVQSVIPTSATAGTDITINGLYLNGPATKVLFGNEEATLKFVSRTAIVCSVPSGLTPGIVKVTVQTGEGSLSDDLNFTVL